MNVTIFKYSLHKIRENTERAAHFFRHSIVDCVVTERTMKLLTLIVCVWCVTLACSKGSYKDSWAPVPCTSCPDNMTTQDTASTRFSQCRPLPGAWLFMRGSRGEGQGA